MGRNLSFCVDVRRVFGHEPKEDKAESSSSSQKPKKKKWRFGRSSKPTTSPSPPVEETSPVPLQSSPVQTSSPVPSPPVEKSSPLLSPVETKSPSPVFNSLSPSPVQTKSPSPIEIKSPSPFHSPVGTKSPSPFASPVPSPPPIRVTPIHITPFHVSSIPITPVHIAPVQEIKPSNESFYATAEPIAINETQVTDEYDEISEEEGSGEMVLGPIADVASSSSRSKEELAAIKIQSLYRGYLARRAVRALKALVRLQTLVEGDSTRHQTATALKAMQALTRIQSQVRSRRIRMHEDNQALHTQLQLKHQRDLEKLKLTEDWNSSIQSKEQIEASLLNRQEASMRRERALAYAFSHQWKASSRFVSTTFLPDPTNPQWGWSWLDRWMGPSRLSETITERESTNSLNPFAPSKTTRKSAEKRLSNPILSPERPSSPALSLSRMSVVSAFSPKRSSARNSHFSATSSILSGAPSSRSYMQPTESAKAKSRLVRTSTDQSEKGQLTDEKKEIGLGKKRLSFSVLDSKAGTSQGRVRKHVGNVKSSDVASVKSVSSFA